ncbi:MAG: hypothetical protein BRD33_02625, partial [Bacteroidetes bacterium QH_6_63_17]
SQVEFKIGEEESSPKLSLPSIPAGQCSVAERTEQLTGPGEYQTVATADIDDQVNETDETNNVREGNLHCRSRGAGGHAQSDRPVRLSRGHKLR